MNPHPTTLSARPDFRPREGLFTSTLPRAIFWAGLIAGTLDITFAMTSYTISTGGDPTRILQNIAGGVFHARAFTGGWIMKAAGLGFHFVVSYVATVSYFLLLPRIPPLHGRPVLAALVFSAGVWCVMNLIVLPITFGGPIRINLGNLWWSFPIFAAVFGLPVSLLARRYFNQSTDYGRP